MASNLVDGKTAAAWLFTEQAGVLDPFTSNTDANYFKAGTDLTWTAPTGGVYAKTMAGDASVYSNDFSNPATAADFSSLGGGTWTIGSNVLTFSTITSGATNYAYVNTVKTVQDGVFQFTFNCPAVTGSRKRTLIVWVRSDANPGQAGSTNIQLNLTLWNNVTEGVGTMALYNIVAGVATQISPAPAYTFNAATNYTVQIRYFGTQLMVYINGAVVCSANTTTVITAAGYCGVGSNNNTGCAGTVVFDNWLNYSPQTAIAVDTLGPLTNGFCGVDSVAIPADRSEIWLIARSNQPVNDSYVKAVFGYDTTNPSGSGNSYIRLSQVSHGIETGLTQLNANTFTLGTNYNLAINFNGATFTAYVNGSSMVSSSSVTFQAGGFCGMACFNGGSASQTYSFGRFNSSGLNTSTADSSPAALFALNNLKTTTNAGAALYGLPNNKHYIAWTWTGSYTANYQYATSTSTAANNSTTTAMISSVKNDWTFDVKVKVDNSAFTGLATSLYYLFYAIEGSSGTSTFPVIVYLTASGGNGQPVDGIRVDQFDITGTGAVTNTLGNFAYTPSGNWDSITIRKWYDGVSTYYLDCWVNGTLVNTLSNAGWDFSGQSTVGGSVSNQFALASPMSYSLVRLSTVKRTNTEVTDWYNSSFTGGPSHNFSVVNATKANRPVGKWEAGATKPPASALLTKVTVTDTSVKYTFDAAIPPANVVTYEDLGTSLHRTGSITQPTANSLQVPLAGGGAGGGTTIQTITPTSTYIDILFAGSVDPTIAIINAPPTPQDTAVTSITNLGGNTLRFNLSTPAPKMTVVTTAVGHVDFTFDKPVALLPPVVGGPPSGALIVSSIALPGGNAFRMNWSGIQP